MERSCRFCRKRVRLVPIGRLKGPVWVHVDRGAGRVCRQRRVWHARQLAAQQQELPLFNHRELF